jgi:hypothetical protein
MFSDDPLKNIEESLCGLLKRAATEGRPYGVT